MGLRPGYMALSFTPQYRFYLGSARKPSGWYVAPYARFTFPASGIGNMPGNNGFGSNYRSDMGIAVGKEWADGSSFEIACSPALVEDLFRLLSR